MLQSSKEQAIPTEIVVILALVLANGVLAGAEIAIVALRKTRIRELVESGSGSARAVEALREQPERFLATVQIGITVVGATAGAFGGATFAEDLEPLVEGVPWLAPHAREISIGLVVSIVSYLSLVLGELVPKSLALKASERYALLIARPLLWLSGAARPLVWFLTQSSNAVLRLFGDRTSFMEGRVSSEELQEMVGEATRAGTVHPDAAEIASRALQFQELGAADVMVPRSQVVALSREATPEEIRSVHSEKSHSRYPVYEGDVDHVVGYVHLKDVLALALDEKPFVLDDVLQAAEAIAAAAVFEHVVVVVRVTVEDQVVRAAGNENARRFVVVNVHLLDDVVAASNAQAPRILAALILRHADNLHAPDVDVVGLYVETGDPAARVDGGKIEDGDLVRVREVLDQRICLARLGEGHAHRAARETVGAAAHPNGIASGGRLLAATDRRERLGFGAWVVVVAIGRDVVVGGERRTGRDQRAPKGKDDRESGDFHPGDSGGSGG